MDKKKIVPAFAPFFKEHGYKKKGNTFFKIENDIAFCILFQRPTSFVYVHYYILPLYIPTDYHYLTYGDRLESHSVYPVPSYDISEEDNDSLSIMRRIKDSLPGVMWNEPKKMDFTEWMEQVQKCLAEDIFPFFESVNSPEKLLRFLREDVREKQKYMPCLGDEYQNSRLAAFTCAHMSDSKSAAEYVARAQKHLINSSDGIVGYVTKLWLDELSVLMQKIEASQETREAFFRETIAHTLDVCFRIRPLEDKKRTP